MIGAIAGKEFRDYMTSRRFLVLFGFLLLVTLLALAQVKTGMISWRGMEGENPKVYEVMWGSRITWDSLGEYSPSHSVLTR